MVHRFLVAILVLHVVVADIARGFDMHASAGCADSAMAATSDLGTDELPARGHYGDCCFGAIMGLPVASAATTVYVAAVAPIISLRAQRAHWYSEGPERPPRI
jgi:hypothetical protein